MPLSNERSQVKSYPTPLPLDLIFYQTQNSDLPKNALWNYGDPHPDKTKYPNHFLVFVTPADDKGLEKCYYAARRECQDLYNFERTDADIGGERFETVSRDYVTLRSEFDAQAPAMGAAMPNVPVGKFAPGSDDATVPGFVLAGRKQGLMDQQELNSLFIVEHMVYARRTPISEVKLDLQTGRSKYSVSNWYYRGELVDGTAIEVLAADPGNAYWGLQASGIFRELIQPTTNWFIVTESRAYPEDSVIGPDNPARTRVISYPTPNGPGRISPLKTDVIFIERGAMPTPEPEYGDPHYDTATWPSHKLVFVKPAGDDAGKLYDFYYAADRINQDLYNFEDSNGEAFYRTYLLTRAEYLSVSPSYFTTLKATVGDDIAGRFSQYVFADESVDRSMPELDSLYVLVKRRYLQKTRTRQFYDDDLDSDITEAVTVIEAGTGSSSSSAGSVTEIQPVNIWHDLQITKTVVGFSTIKTLPILIKDIPYQFPKLLKGAIWTGISVYADSDTAATSYAESWYIYWDIAQPTQGPFEARVRRFLVANPDSLRTTYPIQTIVTKDETIGQARGYWIASSKGNTTYARAEQIVVPESIHGEITIQNSNLIGAIGQSTDKLPASPGFAAFSALTEMNIGYESSKTRYGLYLVEVTQLNLSGVYNGVKVPFGSENPGTSGVGDTSTAIEPPPTPTATITSNNRTISGVASAGNTEVRATAGGVEIGRVMANVTTGAYSMPLTTPYLRDVTEIVVMSRRSGAESLPQKLFSFDLAPLAPSATITTDLTTVSGKTEPGAIVNILKNGSYQVETATVVEFNYQVETLTFVGPITADGLVDIKFTSATTGSPITVQISAVMGDSDETLAQKGAIALIADSTINANWQVMWLVGNTVLARVRVPAADDATAEMEILDPNVTGITPAVSADTVPGDPVTITTAGNAMIVVTENNIAGAPIYFAVAFGDDPDAIAAKAEAALDASTINNRFVASSATNTFALTARTLGPNDPSLNIALSNYTCEGLVDAPNSVQTTPGGTPATVIANADGVYSYPFSPPLYGGLPVPDSLTITATDDGGTSPATVVTASNTPPTISSASFPGGDYDTITGSASPASVVRAYVNNAQVGSAVTSGGGTYNITLSSNLINHEYVEVFATDPVTPTVRSASIFIYAAELDLEVPTYEQSDSLGYFGTAPVGATHIKLRNPGGSLTDIPILMPSRNFSFFITGQNGEDYQLFARYAVGDSDFRIISAPLVELEPPTIEIFDRSRNVVLTTEGSFQRYRAQTTARDGYLMYVTPSVGTTLAQTLISFPGQAPAPYVPSDNKLYPYAVGAPKPTGAGIVDATWRGPMMYLNNGPPGTTNAQLKTIFLAQLPTVMQVTCTATDGRQASRTFDRAEYLEQYDLPNGIYG